MVQPLGLSPWLRLFVNSSTPNHGIEGTQSGNRLRVIGPVQNIRHNHFVPLSLQAFENA